jgi:hypothetical protein
MIKAGLGIGGAGLTKTSIGNYFCLKPRPVYVKGHRPSWKAIELHMFLPKTFRSRPLDVDAETALAQGLGDELRLFVQHIPRGFQQHCTEDREDKGERRCRGHGASKLIMNWRFSRAGPAFGDLVTISADLY